MQATSEVPVSIVEMLTLVLIRGKVSSERAGAVFEPPSHVSRVGCGEMSPQPQKCDSNSVTFGAPKPVTSLYPAPAEHRLHDEAVRLLEPDVIG